MEATTILAVFFHQTPGANPELCQAVTRREFSWRSKNPLVNQHNYGKLPCFMGKLPIHGSLMVTFNSHFDITRGYFNLTSHWQSVSIFVDAEIFWGSHNVSHTWIGDDFPVKTNRIPSELARSEVVIIAQNLVFWATLPSTKNHTFGRLGHKNIHHFGPTCPRRECVFPSGRPNGSASSGKWVDQKRPSISKRSENMLEGPSTMKRDHMRSHEITWQTRKMSTCFELSNLGH